MQPVDGFKTKKTHAYYWYHPVRQRRPKGRVQVSWPAPRYFGWMCATAAFKPGPKALVDVLNLALIHRLPIDKALRCAEAAGLFRK